MTNDYFFPLRRRLTDKEQAYRDDDRCICCATPLHTPPKHRGTGKQHFECKDCARVRIDGGFGCSFYTPAAGTAGLSGEYRRRMGYSVTESGVDLEREPRDRVQEKTPANARGVAHFIDGFHKEVPPKNSGER